ncbi:MAG: hypothetical protein IH840_09725 [Candidatus Heimdallarchaeota archaeon]|nr:hypothetical protein [Candidatus Heimdallarchaeota archaeon]
MTACCLINNASDQFHQWLDDPNPVKVVHKVLLLGQNLERATNFRKKFFQIGLDQDFGSVLGADYALHQFRFRNIDCQYLLVHMAPEIKFDFLKQSLLENTRSAIIIFNHQDDSVVESLDTLLDEIVNANKDDLLSILLVGIGESPDDYNELELHNLLEARNINHKQFVGYMNSNLFDDGEIQELIEKFFLPSLS